MLQPKQTLKEKKNTKDAKEMKNMRPTGPKTGRVKPTMGTAKNGTSMKKAQSGVKLPNAFTKTGKPSLKNSGLIPNTSEEMSKIKKYSPSKFESVKDSTYKPSGKKYKNGGSMIAKSGKSVKKAQAGSNVEPEYEKGLLERAGPMKKTKTKERSTDGDYVKKTVTRTRKGATTTSSKTRRTLQGVMNGAPSVSSMKSGGKMKKCKGGC
jgi:hypothetical protein